jgi:hypothetical protein
MTTLQACLKEEFLIWIKGKISNTFPIDDMVLIFCLNITIEEIYKSKIDNASIFDYSNREELFQIILYNWISIIESTIKTKKRNSNNFFQVIPKITYERKDEILFQLNKINRDTFSSVTF